ncbi:MAG: HAD-IIA family hydrolase [Chloroflexi bacterium]|nr:MAG: HAD-IIA family hydrolase [Chloroflexota bacterium]
MDGVLWRGDTPMPGLAAFFDTLRELGIGFVLATNNATKTAVQYSAKLAGFGVEIPPGQIVTSAEATAAFLQTQYPPKTAVYAVGEQGLHDALTTHQFHLINYKEAMHENGDIPLVVVGFNRHVTYKDLAAAARLIHRGARFIGTNPDVSFPSEYGPLPGAGASLAFLQAATGIEPLIIGKPGPILFQEAMHRLNGTTANTIMVGDRLNTDIAGAQKAGLKAALVLSGITRPEHLATSTIKPDFIFADITDLANYLQGEKTAVSTHKKS